MALQAAAFELTALDCAAAAPQCGFQRLGLGHAVLSLDMDQQEARRVG